MEAELKSLIKVSAAVAASLAYARFAAAKLPPGPRRLLALLPVITLFTYLPWSFTTVQLRGTSASFLAWLGVFKLLLLSYALGPLHPSLPFPTFVVTAALPVKLRSSPFSPTTQLTKPSKPLLIAAVRVAIIAAIVALYTQRYRFPRHLILVFFSIHIYLAQDLVLSAAAAIGLEIEPHFNAPYKSSSLSDFWGRRWNLMVTAVLRPAVFVPVRNRFGAVAGVLSTFLVSGLMHEVMCYYFVPLRPTWESTAFFVLHGVCVVVEDKVRRAGWAPAMPPALKTAATVGFVVATGLWLYYPPISRSGADEMFVEECLASVKAGGRVFAYLFGLSADRISAAVQ